MPSNTAREYQVPPSPLAFDHGKGAASEPTLCRAAQALNEAIAEARGLRRQASLEAGRAALQDKAGETAGQQAQRGSSAGQSGELRSFLARAGHGESGPRGEDDGHETVDAMRRLYKVRPAARPSGAAA